MKHLVLIGLPAVGKTTVGKLLADRLGLEWLDTDIILATIDGLSLQAWYSEPEPRGFKVRETKTLIKCLRRKKISVISTGGGITTKPKNAKAIREMGFCVFLKASYETLNKQKKADPKRNNQDYRNSPETVNRNNKRFKEQADLTVCIDGLTPTQVVNKIEVML